MTRWTVFALLLVCLALAGVGVWVVHAVKHDRAALVDQFGADRLAQVDKAAREIETELDDVADDLRFAGRLVQAADNPGDREREVTSTGGRYQSPAVTGGTSGSSSLADPPTLPQAAMMPASTSVAHEERDCMSDSFRSGFAGIRPKSAQESRRRRWSAARAHVMQPALGVRSTDAGAAHNLRPCWPSVQDLRRRVRG